jgi:diguanylate cyclase (GGDEF)-like protein
LLAFPAMAGTAASQTCTFLACLAIAAATISATAALRGVVPARVRRGVILLGLSIAALGVPAALVTGESIDWLATLLNMLVLGDLVAVASCIAWGWRNGSGEARDLAKSWGLPMAILALTQLFDFNTLLFGGGAQIAVLFASALQSIWLSIAVTRRLSGIRIELDAARAAESALAELARRDPLTGLLNRRGFVDCLGELFSGRQEPLGLLLIDVDHFKAINDQYGHEIGDAVLCRIAEYFRGLEAESCLSGRMGGEEFVLATSGLAPSALAQFADRVREGVAACDHGKATRHRVVTVSIGVAEGSTKTQFQKLYAAADRALYDAKRSGRNKVVFYSEEGLSREELERDQFAFAWPVGKPV